MSDHDWYGRHVTAATAATAHLAHGCDPSRLYVDASDSAAAHLPGPLGAAIAAVLAQEAAERTIPPTPPPCVCTARRSSLALAVAVLDHTIGLETAMTVAHQLAPPAPPPDTPTNAVPTTAAGGDNLHSRLQQLLTAHQAGHLAAAVHELLTPHITEHPTTDGPIPVVPTDLVIRLHQLLPSWPAIGLPAAVLHVAEPWLRRPTPPAPEREPAPEPVAQPAPEPAPEHPAPPPTRVPEVSERELQVLRGLAGGHTNADIARDLYLSEHTVKTHVRRLCRKIGARDRAHAVDTGWRLRLLP